MSKKEVGYGVLGLGVGKAHVAGAVHARGCKFVAICDSNEELLASIGDEFGIDPANRFTSFEQMLARSDIDVISVCTPSGMHRDHAVQALYAGKHVLVEKPLDISLDNINDILRAEEETGKYVGCMFQKRLLPGNQ